MLLYYGDNALVDIVNKLHGCFFYEEQLWYGSIDLLTLAERRPFFEATCFDCCPTRQFVNLPQKSQDPRKTSAGKELFLSRGRTAGTT